jgi:hypothetical protein
MVTIANLLQTARVNCWSYGAAFVNLLSGKTQGSGLRIANHRHYFLLTIDNNQIARPWYCRMCRRYDMLPPWN